MNKLKTFLSLVVVILTLGLSQQKSFAQNAKTWVANKADVRFVVKNFGANTNGSLSGLNAYIVFDANNMEGNVIDAYLLSNSINTNNSMRDGHLRKADYFDVAKYDKIQLKATSFSNEGGGNYKGNFKLTLKGVTKNVTIPFNFQSNGNNATIKGAFTINRLDYGVGETSMSLANNVTININVGLVAK